MTLVTPGIPAFLSHLETYNGAPIAWAQAVKDGVPQPYVDPPRRDVCWQEKRCGVCWAPLDYRMGFLVQGRDEEYARGLRWHLQPALHPRCAPYAGMTPQVGWTTFCAITRGYKVKMWPGDAKRGLPPARKAHAAPYTAMERLAVPLAVKADGTRRSPSGLIIP